MLDAAPTDARYGSASSHGGSCRGWVRPSAARPPPSGTSAPPRARRPARPSCRASCRLLNLSRRTDGRRRPWPARCHSPWPRPPGSPSRTAPGECTRRRRRSGGWGGWGRQLLRRGEPQEARRSRRGTRASRGNHRIAANCCVRMHRLSANWRSLPGAGYHAVCYRDRLCVMQNHSSLTLPPDPYVAALPNWSRAFAPQDTLAEGRHVEPLRATSLSVRRHPPAARARIPPGVRRGGRAPPRRRC